MEPAPTLPDDGARVLSLHRLRVLDSAPERDFDRIVELAAQICVMPTAMVTLVDRDRQWFKARLGLTLEQTGRDESFCAHAIARPDETLVIEDSLADPRFADNPLVSDEPRIRFYAGAPVVTSDGQALGTVCVVDRAPRTLEPWQLAALRTLAGQVGRLLEQRHLSGAERAQAWSGLRGAHRDVQRLAAIAASGDELTAYIDDGGRCRYVNDHLARVWGGERDALLGQHAADIVGRALYEAELEPLLAQALAGRTVSTELALPWPGPQRRQWLLHLEPSRAADGAVVGAVVRGRDVQPFMDRMGELAASVDRLESRLLAQERLLRILAHDLREPLNTMTSVIELAQADAVEPKLQRFLGFAQGGAARMREVIDGLMRYVLTGGESLVHEEVDLGALVEMLREDLADALQRSGGRLEAGPLPRLRGDPALLRVLMQNLIGNALKYQRPGVPPVVRVTAREAGDAHEISVCDNGRGIPADARETVFDLFRRLAGGDVPGAGLGLSICRRIVEQHGGTIRADDGPGGAGGPGACLRVRWPRGGPPAAGAGR